MLNTLIGKRKSTPGTLVKSLFILLVGLVSFVISAFLIILMSFLINYSSGNDVPIQNQNEREGRSSGELAKKTAIDEFDGRLQKMLDALDDTGRLLAPNLSGNEKDVSKKGSSITPLLLAFHGAGIKLLSSNQLWNYLAITVCLGLCINIVIYHLTLGLSSRKAPLVASLFDWAINAPPILGVVGTIVAFSSLVSNSSFRLEADQFAAAFFDAAMTTALGGLVYVINLLLYVLISSSRELNSGS